ncbi:MAG: hypothetical protein ABR548_05690 [Actinomycetota bacterium]|nr:hypothetical protein [Actinomycetota bacterium]
MGHRARFIHALGAAGLFACLFQAAHAAPAAPTLSLTDSVITPYTSTGCLNRAVGCYALYGTTSPGARVVVTVSDTLVPSSSITVSTYAAERDDPGSGIAAGAFAVSPRVTDLGTHGTEASQIVFTAVAVDGAGNASTPASITATKLAATSGDDVAPVMRLRQSPPAVWCAAACGALTGHRSCYGNLSCPSTITLSGSVEDNVPAAFGIASEIADVVVAIADQATGAPIAEFHAVTRRGMQGFFAVTLHHEDYQLFGRYSWSVRAFDALGHASNTSSGSFTVIPG